MRKVKKPQGLSALAREDYNNRVEAYATLGNRKMIWWPLINDKVEGKINKVAVIEVAKDKGLIVIEEDGMLYLAILQHVQSEPICAQQQEAA